MADLYLWLKTVHLLAIILWAGPMLVLPWRFVALIKYRANPDKELLLLEMIRNVMKRVIPMAMGTAYLSGIGLIYVLNATGGITMGWIHTKITLAVILSGCHGLLSRSYRKMVKHGEEPKSQRFYLMIAIVSTLCVLGAVTLAVQKPF